MTFAEVCALLTLLGAAICGTFSIAWKVFQEIHNNEKK